MSDSRVRMEKLFTGLNLPEEEEKFLRTIWKPEQFVMSLRQKVHNYGVVVFAIAIAIGVGGARFYPGWKRFSDFSSAVMWFGIIVYPIKCLFSLVSSASAVKGHPAMPYEMQKSISETMLQPPFLANLWTTNPWAMWAYVHGFMFVIACGMSDHFTTAFGLLISNAISLFVAWRCRIWLWKNLRDRTRQYLRTNGGESVVS